MKKTNRYIIPPQWDKVVLGLFSFAILFFLFRLYASGVKAHETYNNTSIFHVLISIAVLFYVSRSYVIDSRGVTMCFFFLPYNRLHWYNVDEIIIVRDWEIQGRSQPDSVVLIISDKSTPFIPGQDQVEAFASSHFFDAVSFHIQKTEVDKYEKILNSFCDNVVVLQYHK